MMIQTVCPAYLGSQENFYQTAPLIAAQGQFEGYYSYDILADTAQGVEKTREMFDESELRPVGFRLPIELHASSVCFRHDFASLQETIRTAHAIGYPLGLTWIMPGSNEIAPNDYQPLLVSRLKRLSQLLAEYDMQLAVELVAPYTIQSQYRHPIPVTIDYLLELIAQTGQKNIGIVLDIFHFFCARHKDEDLQLLHDRTQIKMVHISDGMPGCTPEQQQDQDRRLPGQTGVIDCEAMFRHLQHLGYDGSVIPEPLDPVLAALPFSEALGHTAKAMQRVWPKAQTD